MCCDCRFANKSCKGSIDLQTLKLSWFYPGLFPSSYIVLRTRQLPSVAYCITMQFPGPYEGGKKKDLLYTFAHIICIRIRRVFRTISSKIDCKLKSPHELDH